ncbi:MAG TPA: TIGR03118 family protein [Methylomirabilota bacterium]|nr:TIGR03118 family protein [Methylomirabilota bacterium]
MKLTKRFVALLGCLGFAMALGANARAAGPGYVQTDLITDIPALATATGARLDPNLLNPWGLAFFAGLSPFWINENNAGFSALDFADGVAFPGLPDVIIPAPAAPTGGTPTGIVADIFSSPGVFDIVPVSDPGANFGSSLFIFDTEDGTIEAWNQTILPNILSAVIVVDNSAGGGPTGAVYKGLALGSNVANGPLLYATNFRTGKVDVFDKNFKAPTPPLTGSFTDPKVQRGYAPFGIQNINGQIWVTYAMQDKPKHDPVNKPAHGFVAVFDTNGNLIRHFAQHGHLDSPWGLAMAPATFGKFANDMLIGNFGNGVINVFDPKTGHWLGALPGTNGRPLVNDGLWALTFGGALNSDTTVSSPGTLFFSAGLNDEADGLFGRIDPQ